jgi:hypothetical protein
MTNDGTNLIMTDGSAKIYFRDPSSFDLLRTVVVMVHTYITHTHTHTHTHTSSIDMYNNDVGKRFMK